MVRKASAEERISRGAAGDAQMDIFPALEPVTLSAIKLGSLCARVRNGRLALGIIVGSWLGAPHRSWIQFEGDGEAWRAVDIDEAAQEEEALNVRDARCGCDSKARALAPTKTPLLRDPYSWLVVGRPFPEWLATTTARGAFVVEDGSFVQIRRAKSYPYFSSSWEIEAPDASGSWRRIFSR
jgi:hypothetical protein